MAGQSIRKSFLGVILLTTFLAGCGGSGAVTAPEPAENLTAAEPVAEEPAEVQAEQDTPAAEEQPETESAAEEAVPGRAERLLPGYQILYEVQDDGTLKKLLDVGGHEYIMYADASETGVYAVTEKRTESEGADKLYYVDSQGVVHDAALNLGTSGKTFQAHSFAVHDGRLVYHLSGDDPTIYAYDPVSRRIIEDSELTALQTKLNELIDDTKWALAYNTSAPAMLERSGCLMLTDNEGHFFRYDAEGKEIENWNILKPSAWYVPYDPHTVVGLDVEIRDNGNIVHGCLYNPETHTIRSFTPRQMDNPYGSFVTASRDGRYVYYLNQKTSGDENVLRRTLYRLDTDHSEEEELEVFSVEPPPSFSEPYATDENGILFAPGRIRFVGDSVYYLEYQEGQGFVWMTAPLDASSSAKPAGGTDCDLPYASYGRVARRMDIRQKKEANDRLYYSGEFENFFLRDDFPGAEKINGQLQKLYREIDSQGDSMAQQAENDFFGEEAGDWMSGVPGYSYTFTFDGVDEPAKNYLQIRFGGYEFWGGAHGMPFQVYCLFDTRTGERLDIKDLFTGGEDAFKELVADYTLEDWKKNDEFYYESYTPGDEEQEKKQREAFKEAASLSMDISYGEKGITVYYSPYSVAPYAAGYIMIDIPYEALGFALK